MITVRGSTVRKPAVPNGREHNKKERAQFLSALKLIVKTLVEGGMSHEEVADFIDDIL